LPWASWRSPPRRPPPVRDRRSGPACGRSIQSKNAGRSGIESAASSPSPWYRRLVFGKNPAHCGLVAEAAFCGSRPAGDEPRWAFDGRRQALWDAIPERLDPTCGCQVASGYRRSRPNQYRHPADGSAKKSVNAEAGTQMNAEMSGRMEWARGGAAGQLGCCADSLLVNSSDESAGFEIVMA